MIVKLSKSFINDLSSIGILKENFSINDSFSKLSSGQKEDIFLSYSYVDKDYALKIYQMLIKEGFTVYIDVKDSRLDRSEVNKETAKRLSQIMNGCRCLIYIHTKAATISKWCP